MWMYRKFTRTHQYYFLNWHYNLVYGVVSTVMTMTSQFISNPITMYRIHTSAVGAVLSTVCNPQQSVVVNISRLPHHTKSSQSFPIHQQGSLSPRLCYAEELIQNYYRSLRYADLEYLQVLNMVLRNATLTSSPSRM